MLCMQLDANGIYLTDDRNRVLLPEDDGKFDPNRLLEFSHFKVIGRTENTGLAASSSGSSTVFSSVASTSLASPADYTRLQSFGTPSSRQPAVRTLKRY